MPNVSPSNLTNLAIAEETIGSPGVLPGTPIWVPYEPNSYSDFGGQLKSAVRKPITSSRQIKKGQAVDLDASAGFTSEFMSETFTRLLQGFLFADWRSKGKMGSTAVSATQFTVASGGAAYVANSLLWADGFSVAGNNGLKLVSASTGTTISASGLAIEASPPAVATVYRVGQQGAAGDLVMAVNSGIPQLNSTALNFTTLGLIPGEWIWIGGDAAITQFAQAVNNGFYRIKSIASNAMVFDRWPSASVADAGTGKTIQFFFGEVLKNEWDPTIQKLRTYTIERKLLANSYEYVKGAAPNTLAINVKKTDKVGVELNFVGLSTERATAPKAGTREALPIQQTMFNASTSVSRIRFYDDTTGASLATYLDEFKVSIDNGIDPVKAVSVLGGVDINYGDFAVSGSLTALFTSTTAVDAVMNNDYVGFDFALVEKAGPQNVADGWLFDIPVLTLGDGRIKVEKDKPITLPISFDAAEHDLYNHTMMIVDFSYLPNAAL